MFFSSVTRYMKYAWLRLRTLNAVGLLTFTSYMVVVFVTQSAMITWTETLVICVNCLNVICFVQSKFPGKPQCTQCKVFPDKMSKPLYTWYTGYFRIFPKGNQIFDAIQWLIHVTTTKNQNKKRKKEANRRMKYWGNQCIVYVTLRCNVRLTASNYAYKSLGFSSSSSTNTINNNIIAVLQIFVGNFSPWKTDCSKLFDIQISCIVNASF